MTFDKGAGDWRPILGAQTFFGLAPPPPPPEQWPGCRGCLGHGVTGPCGLCGGFRPVGGVPTCPPRAARAPSARILGRGPAPGRPHAPPAARPCPTLRPASTRWAQRVSPTRCARCASDREHTGRTLRRIGAQHGARARGRGAVQPSTLGVLEAATSDRLPALARHQAFA